MKSPQLKPNIFPSLADFLKRDSGSCLFFFLAGLTLRGIPELLVPIYPVGYETITYYAPPMMSFLGRSVADVMVGFFSDGPLFYMLMWLVVNLTKAHPFLILKAVGPLLYGCVAVSFFVFLKKGLKLEGKMAFLATFLLIFQVAALRESWDRFRNMLALVFFFSCLTALRSDSKHKWWFVAVLAILTAISREYVSLVLFVAALSLAVLEKKDRLTSLVALCPALVTFSVTVYPRLLWSTWNYTLDSQYTFRSYSWILQDALVIFFVCYAALLPFVVKGRHKDRLIGPITCWLMLGSFSVISPWYALPGYQRWLMLLVFPFVIYTVKGFDRLGLFSEHRLTMKVVVLIFVVIGAGYSTGAFSYVSMFPNSYVAVNLVQSSVDWSQVGDVKDVLKRLDEIAASNSSVLVEERFYGWALIYLKRANNDVNVVVYGAGSSPSENLEKMLSTGLRWIYLIWYSNLKVENFHAIYSQNTVSIFQYNL